MRPERNFTPPPDGHPRRRWANHPVAIFVTGVAMGIGGTLGVQATNQPSEVPVVKPGGMWESPRDKDKVGDVIHFAAQAYPTREGDIPVAYVNFTALVKGAWQIACRVPPPKQGTEYSCDWTIPEPLREPDQIIIVSFDVYDREGNVNKAPNGEHILVETQ